MKENLSENNDVKFDKPNSRFYCGLLTQVVYEKWQYGDFKDQIYMHGTSGTAALYVIVDGKPVELSTWANGHMMKAPWPSNVKLDTAQQVTGPELHNDRCFSDPQLGLVGVLVKFRPPYNVDDPALSQWPPLRPLRPLEQAIPWRKHEPSEIYRYGLSLDANNDLISYESQQERGGGLFPLSDYIRYYRNLEKAIGEDGDVFAKFCVARAHNPGKTITVQTIGTYDPSGQPQTIFQLDLGEIVDSIHHPLEWAYLVNRGYDDEWDFVRRFDSDLTNIRMQASIINGLYPTGDEVAKQAWFKNWQLTNIMTPEMLDWFNQNGQAEAFLIAGKNYRLWMEPVSTQMPNGILGSGIHFKLVEVDTLSLPTGGPDLALTSDLLIALEKEHCADCPTLEQLRQADTQDQSITSHRAEWVDNSSGTEMEYTASDGRRFACYINGSPIQVSSPWPKIDWRKATPAEIAWANKDYLAYLSKLGA